MGAYAEGSVEVLKRWYMLDLSESERKCLVQTHFFNKHLIERPDSI